MVDISNESGFEVGEWRVDPKTNLLSRGGETVAIEPRVMELLVYLARHAGEVVSSDDIFGQVWPNVVVGDNSLYRGIAQIRKVLGDSTAEPRYIATIPKRGYRLVAPVQWLTLEQSAAPEVGGGSSGVDVEDARSGTPVRRNPPHRWILAGAVLAVALVLGLFWTSVDDSPPDAGSPPTGRLTSIAVLPFTNVSTDPGNDYFALGLSDEILSTLGHVKGLDVVARTTSYSLGDVEDVREIGSKLDVDGVVEGGVRKSGNRIRVNVQLIDTASGFDLWAGEYDRELDDVFEIQEEIAESILAALGEQLDVVLPMDLPSPGGAELEAYDLYLLGRHYVRGRDPEELEKAVDLFRNAIGRDQNYAPAYSGLAEAYLLQAEYGGQTLDRALLLAEPILNNALALDQTLAEPYATRGLARFLERRHEEAQQALGTALQLNPSHTMAGMWLGLSLAYDQGRLNESQRLYERGLSLDPLNVTLAINMAYNLSRQGRYAEALERLETAGKQHPGDLRIQLGIAQVAADFGRFDSAHQAAAKALAIEPGSARAMTMLAYSYANLGALEAAAHWIDRVEESGGDTSHWHVSMAIMAIYLQKGEMSALAEFLESQIDQNFKPDPLLFFAPRLWQPYGAAGTGRMLMGEFPAASVFFDSHLQSVREVRMTQTFEDSIFFLVNSAYVHREMGQRTHFEQRMTEALGVAVQARADGWDTNKLAFYEARAYVLEGEPDKAMAALEKAVENGFHDFWWLASDPLWSGFAEDDAFRRVMASMQQRRIEMLRHIENSTREAVARHSIHRSAIP